MAEILVTDFTNKVDNERINLINEINSIKKEPIPETTSLPEAVNIAKDLMVETDIENPALPEDIRVGKSAYANKEKVNGTMQDVDVDLYVDENNPLLVKSNNETGYITAKTKEINLTDKNLIPSNIRAGKSIFGVEGNLEPDKPNQVKTISPEKFEQTVIADIGYELESVKVNPVTSSIDGNIVPENIKKDVEILGVTGTLEEGIIPTGELNITENGTYDVTNYASANVNIESVGGAGGEYNIEVVDVDDGTQELHITKATGLPMDRLQWKCDNVKRLSYEFYGYEGLDLSPALNGLDTSNVVIMSNMFSNCRQLKSLDLSGFDTSNVTGMSYMFSECNNLTNLDVSSFNTSNVTKFDRMFYLCRKVTELDVSGFDTSNATDISYMFSECNNIRELDLSNFNTSNVTTMYNLFYCCHLITSLDLSSFDTTNVKNVGYMFANCEALTKIIGIIDVVNVTSTTNIFNVCEALTTFTLKNIKKSLTIGSGTKYGTLLDDPTIINTGMELHDLTGATSQTLTVSTATSARLDAIYVKLIEATDEMIANDPYITSKKPCVVCESTDEGAMTLREYVVSKNWGIVG